jgi:hypothetical protein
MQMDERDQRLIAGRSATEHSAGRIAEVHNGRVSDASRQYVGRNLVFSFVTDRPVSGTSKHCGPSVTGPPTREGSLGTAANCDRRRDDRIFSCSRMNTGWSIRSGDPRLGWSESKWERSRGSLNLQAPIQTRCADRRRPQFCRGWSRGLRSIGGSSGNGCTLWRREALENSGHPPAISGWAPVMAASEASGRRILGQQHSYTTRSSRDILDIHILVPCICCRPVSWFVRMYIAAPWRRGSMAEPKANREPVAALVGIVDGS